MQSYKEGNNSLLQAISIQICHAAVRSYFGNEQEIPLSDWRTEIGRSLAYIHSNLHEKIGLQEIAGAAHMSVSNYSRVFKREMNKTPLEYLQEQRLYKALNMLMTNEFTMLEIADSCGFSSVSYLSTSFKKRYFMSPEKYRLQFEKVS